MTLALLRRVVWTAAGTSGAYRLRQSVADGVLAHLPILNKIAALQLRRLADITARASSPF